jgi:hypothetical protein
MKKKNKDNKKGDISSAFLITVILGVIAFGIILIVYSQFTWTATADQETCHQSVIYRATLPTTLGAKTFVPLKCKTEKICFTSGIIGGKCSEFENFQGITKVKVNTKEQVEQAIAKKIIDCWSMMGEAKLSLFNNWWAETYGLADVTSSCVICSRMAFDKNNLAKSGIDTQNIDVSGYMTKHYIPGKKITYYDYLGGTKGQLYIKNEDLDKTLKELIAKLNKTASIDSEPDAANSNIQNPNSDEFAIMFMQIYSPTYEEVLKNTFFALVGGGTFVALGGGGKLVSVLCKGPGAYVCGILGAGAIAYQGYTVYNNNAIAAGKCGDIAVGDETKTGCTVVRTIDYNAEDLSKYCSKIESIA